MLDKIASVSLTSVPLITAASLFKERIPEFLGPQDTTENKPRTNRKRDTPASLK
jgi:hypothetical protein